MMKFKFIVKFKDEIIDYEEKYEENIENKSIKSDI